VEKTVVPERKDVGAGARVTKARSKEVGNTAEAMSKDEKDNQKSSIGHEICRCRVDSFPAIDLQF